MKKKNDEIIPLEVISQKIFIIRGIKVMLDVDLARLYGVPTMRLNEQVKRNKSRFPEDFMFQLNEGEKGDVIAICDNLSKLKFSHSLPYVFTEHGVAMLSAVLRSPRAVQINIYIIRAFIKLREYLSTSKDLTQRVGILEREQMDQNNHIQIINDIVKKLIDEPVTPKKKIGFSK